MARLLYRYMRAAQHLTGISMLSIRPIPTWRGLTALNTSNPERIADNVKSANDKIPPNFWKALKENRLLEENYPYL